MDLLKIVDGDFLRVVLAGYSALLQVPVTLFIPRDGRDILRLDAYTSGSYVTDFCKYLQLTQEGGHWCHRHHQRVARDSLTSNPPRPMWVSCWMGLLNFAVPVVVNDRKIAVLYGGQFMLQDREEHVRSYVARLDLPTSVELTNQYQALESLPRIRDEEASFVLERANALSAQLVDVIERLSVRPGAPTLSITEYLERSRLTTVLVLGKDTGPELKLLQRISEILAQFGYSPILAKDLPDIPEMSNEDKVRSLADASRFVLLENSFPAGQIAECKILSTNRIVTAFLREERKGSSFMVTDYHRDYDFMNEFTYKASDSSTLAHSVEAATSWAEGKIIERRDFFNARYPWRKQAEVNTDK